MEGTGGGVRVGAVALKEVWTGGSEAMALDVATGAGGSDGATTFAFFPDTQSSQTFCF